MTEPRTRSSTWDRDPKMTWPEIAKHLGITESMAKKIHRQALNKLRSAIEEDPEIMGSINEDR